MADDVLLNKAATIECCVARARDEFNAAPQTFATHFTRQDAAISSTPASPWPMRLHWGKKMHAWR